MSLYGRFLVFNELSLPFDDKYKAKNEFRIFNILNSLQKEYSKDQNG